MTLEGKRAYEQAKVTRQIIEQEINKRTAALDDKIYTLTVRVMELAAAAERLSERVARLEGPEAGGGGA